MCIIKYFLSLRTLILVMKHILSLQNLQLSLPEEENRVKGIRVLGEKVLPGTVDSGQVNIRAQIDSSQQDWEGLLSAVQ